MISFTALKNILKYNEINRWIEDTINWSWIFNVMKIILWLYFLTIYTLQES